jgi:hypothetical protein
MGKAHPEVAEGRAHVLAQQLQGHAPAHHLS